MTRIYFSLLTAIFTFFLGVIITFAILLSTPFPSIEESVANSCSWVVDNTPKQEVIIELWLADKITGNKISFSTENTRFTGELIQLNATKEKELVILSCPNQGFIHNPKCTIAVYEKNGKSYKQVLQDTLDWYYAAEDGEISGTCFGQWGKGVYKDLHVLANGGENIYFYSGSEYKLQEHRTYSCGNNVIVN